jgi:hypothetical protein
MQSDGAGAVEVRPAARSVAATARAVAAAQDLLRAPAGAVSGVTGKPSQICNVKATYVTGMA